MHDLLGLEYINMCHYLKTEAEEAEECFMLHSILPLPLISEKKQDVSPPQSVVWKETRVYACVRKKEEKKKDLREPVVLHCLNAILLQGKKENETTKSYLRERFVFIRDKSCCRFEPIHR